MLPVIEIVRTGYFQTYTIYKRIISQKWIFGFSDRHVVHLEMWGKMAVYAGVYYNTSVYHTIGIKSENDEILIAGAITGFRRYSVSLSHGYFIHIAYADSVESQSGDFVLIKCFGNLHHFKAESMRSWSSMYASMESSA